MQSFWIGSQFFCTNVITNAIGCYHQLSLFFGHAVFQQLDEHLRALAVPHQEEGATVVVMCHIILEGIVDVFRRDLCQRIHYRFGLLIGLKDHLAVIRRIEVVLAIQHFVEPLVAVGFLAHFGQADVGKPR